ncbi:MAG: rod shape-determining protein MreD [Nitrosospira sp.]|nr:rod shape-determining protein MreD [Nitrosospira sp.]
MPIEYTKQEIVRPIKARFIIFSLIVALLLNQQSLPGIVSLLCPDFLALVILYWNIYHSKQFGMGAAFSMGLLMDVSEANVLGQHAMAYSVMIFFVSTLCQRFQMFRLPEQIFQIGLLLLAAESLILLIKLLNGAQFQDWNFFFASLIGALFWPLLVFFLRKLSSGAH